MNHFIPNGLRIWFIIHCVVDIIFAIPLLALPEIVLPILGWRVVDPIGARLVGAALFGIGLSSALVRNETAEVFKALLTLKILWSGAALVGISIAILLGAPSVSWAIGGIFLGFFLVWIYYRRRLR